MNSFAAVSLPLVLFASVWVQGRCSQFLLVFADATGYALIGSSQDHLTVQPISITEVVRASSDRSAAAA